MNTENKEQKKHDATTKQAAVLIAWYHWCIVRNIGKGIDRLVRKYPWQSIVTTTILTVALAMLISFIFISKARAERDSYNKNLVHAQMQLDSYKAVYGDSGKEVK